MGCEKVSTIRSNDNDFDKSIDSLTHCKGVSLAKLDVIKKQVD